MTEKQTQGVAGYNNTALIKLSWSGSDTPCWFNLKPSAGAAVGKGANSDNWSFDISERAATTVGLSSSAAPTPTPSPTSSSTSVTTTTSETPTGTRSAAPTTTSSDESTTTSSAGSTPTLSEESADESTGGSLVLATSTRSAATETSSASSAGLSTGAQIGTGIGVAIGGIFIGVAAGIWYMRRRRQKAKQGAFARIEAPPTSTGPPSSVGEWKPPVVYAAEVPHQIPLSELRGHPPPAASELPAAQSVYYELPTHTGR